jgi:hypothetical protein
LFSPKSSIHGTHIYINVGALSQCRRTIEKWALYWNVDVLWKSRCFMKMSALYEKVSALWKYQRNMKMSGPCTTRDKKYTTTIRWLILIFMHLFHNQNFRISKHFNNFHIRNFVTLETSLLGTFYLYPIHDTTHSQHSEFIRLNLSPTAPFAPPPPFSDGPRSDWT